MSSENEEAKDPADESPAEAAAPQDDQAVAPQADDEAQSALGEEDPPAIVDGSDAASDEPAVSQPVESISVADVDTAAEVLGLPPEESETVLPERTAELKSIVEALIFASPDPLTPKALYKLLDSEPKEDVAAAIEALKVDYERPSGLQLVEVAGGFQIVTRPDLHEWVRRLFHERSTQKLSVQALETLAVVAYRQPVTALEITEIRGVNTSGVMNTLLERHLIKIVGRKQVVGRPFMYATTKEFLIRFGLKDLGDLPKVEDMAEALGIEHPLLVEQAPVEEQLPLVEPDEAAGSESGERFDVEPDDDFATDGPDGSSAGEAGHPSVEDAETTIPDAGDGQAAESAGSVDVPDPDDEPGGTIH